MQTNHFLQTGTPSSLAQWLLCHLPSQTEILAHLPHRLTLMTIAGGLVLLRLATVQALRWQRYNAIHLKYGPKWNNGLGKITPQEAQEIIHVSTVFDMPQLLLSALSFALFKTYGIPSISKLLAGTKELKSKETVSRRFADTVILIATWHACPISGFSDPLFAFKNTGPNAKPAEDPRANIALARVNWLHSKYKISNSDYLYTLCLFASEPINWSERYGWRSVSPLERHAFYVFWAEVGKKMNIQNIPENIDAMIAWSKKYADKHMVPAKTNREVAGYTLGEFVSPVPNVLGLKAFATNVALCFLDDVTRDAMMYQRPPSYLRAGVNGCMAILAFVQRFLLLPRRSGKYTVDIGTLNNFKPGECPRLRPTRYAVRPWYRPEASSAVGYYTDKLLVALGWYEEMPGPQLKSGGYRLEEMGPSRFENVGHEEIMRNAAKMQGCPIAGPWSLDGRKVTPDL